MTLPRSFTLLHALNAATFLASASSLFPAAETIVVEFAGQNIAASGPQGGDLPLPRSPERARNATRTLYPLGPSYPFYGYNGPVFSLGYEIKCDAPSNLSVPEDQLMIEDDFRLPNGKKTDTLSLTLTGDWPRTTTYSVAAVVVFPTREFSLQSLAYAANNWGDKTAKPYNDKVRHRWVVVSDGKYYVNIGFLARTSIKADEPQGFQIVRNERGSSLNDRWVTYDPQRSIFAPLDGPVVSMGDALERVTAVGFYMDCVDFNGTGGRAKQWQLKLIQFTATGYPTDAR